MNAPQTNAPLAILVDGETAGAATHWALDRGLHYGDGLFETMLVRDSRVRFEALHRARLAEGCRRLHIAVDPDLPWQQARQLAGRHPLEECGPSPMQKHPHIPRTQSHQLGDLGDGHLFELEQHQHPALALAQRIQRLVELGPPFPPL